MLTLDKTGPKSWNVLRDGKPTNLFVELKLNEVFKEEGHCLQKRDNAEWCRWCGNLKAALKMAQFHL